MVALEAKLKVFIIDDSATIRERLVAMVLELSGIVVVGQAQDAPEVLEAIRRTQPDVVILDIRLPGGSGVNVLHRLKKAKLDPKVIMFTSYSQPQYRRACEAAGADFFFDKGTEFHKIPHALEQLRQGQRAEPNLDV
jgi:DNA-binding NarL/FixJ family response regulator